LTTADHAVKENWQLIQRSEMPDESEEFKNLWKIAEDHAFSVRQLTAQRTRLWELIDTIGKVALFDSGASIQPVIEAAKRSPSQFLNEIFCLLLNRGKRDGFFVEFGACDGRLISNTWILESEFGWGGILAEPNPSWHDALKSNRSCVIDTRCVWTETGSKLQFAEFNNDDYNTQSRVISATDNKRDLVSGLYEVETISLLDLLRQHGAPTKIDFMSIDIEGGEADVLRTFPFGEYQVDFLCVEQHGENELKVKEILESSGYKQILKDASGHDGFYVPTA
jgi:FkbM family methyltransferase